MKVETPYSLVDRIVNVSAFGVLRVFHVLKSFMMLNVTECRVLFFLNVGFLSESSRSNFQCMRRCHFCLFFFFQTVFMLLSLDWPSVVSV